MLIVILLHSLLMFSCAQWRLQDLRLNLTFGSFILLFPSQMLSMDVLSGFHSQLILYHTHQWAQETDPWASVRALVMVCS